MANWINYIKSVNPDFIWKNRLNNNFGDWLEVNAHTNNIVLATAYYARDTMLMSKIAAAIGKTEDAKMYSDLFQNISNAFNKNYVKPDGTIEGDTQSVTQIVQKFIWINISIKCFFCLVLRFRFGIFSFT